jgi:cytochrome c oxidase cbb3-type subunit I/II
MLRSNLTSRPSVRVLAAALGTCLAACSDAGLLRRGAMPSTPLPAVVAIRNDAAHRGMAVYDRNCESCHGERGDGRGSSAALAVPRPRNFVTAIFHCRSTASGSLPLPSDLAVTTQRGVHDTAMPGWEPLGTSQIRDVTEYLRTFSPRWRDEPVPYPIQIPAEPPDDGASRARGEALYARACVSCHGDHGLGDGPAASALRDEAGQPIAPFDFTNGELRCGSEPSDMYRTLMTGMDGTPMPSFSASFTPIDAWDVVHHVRSLRSSAPTNEVDVHAHHH